MKFLSLLAVGFLWPSLSFAQSSTDAWWSSVLDYSWPLMSFVLGLIDGFNPCAMWTLFILLGFLLTMEDQRKRLMIGGVFIASSGLIYLAALFTYLIGFQAITTLIATKSMTYVFTLIGLMSMIAGGWAVYTYRTKGIECDVRDAASKKKFHQKLGAILEREQLWLVLAGMVLLAFFFACGKLFFPVRFYKRPITVTRLWYKR